MYLKVVLLLVSLYYRNSHELFPLPASAFVKANISWIYYMEMLCFKTFLKAKEDDAILGQNMCHPRALALNMPYFRRTLDQMGRGIQSPYWCRTQGVSVGSLQFYCISSPLRQGYYEKLDLTVSVISRCQLSHKLQFSHFWHLIKSITNLTILLKSYLSRCMAIQKVLPTQIQQLIIADGPVHLVAKLVKFIKLKKIQFLKTCGRVTVLRLAGRGLHCHEEHLNNVSITVILSKSESGLPDFIKYLERLELPHFVFINMLNTCVVSSSSFKPYLLTLLPTFRPVSQSTAKVPRNHRKDGCDKLKLQAFVSCCTWVFCLRKRKDPDFGMHRAHLLLKFFLFNIYKIISAAGLVLGLCTKNCWIWGCLLADLLSSYSVTKCFQNLTKKAAVSITNLNNSLRRAIQGLNDLKNKLGLASNPN
ncbi:hypothetical protein EGR_03537 [Echinococcus granulosus]|uniref:Uncharacterized protein n=1 Tax=Echinococcus granulosus TaxID=6210 RepID=W6UKX3_ECHGR|nr:hypothetical protein EGR_03537 [Echinococcus granulosus]EUB61723.1 hypothetical protein EGR_03537 [Echinococcus granulosus]